MAVYITQQELIDRLTLPELLRLTRKNPLNTVLVDAARTDASSAIDTFAVGTFGYPWATVPTQAVDAAFAITCYYLHQRCWPGTPIPLHLSEPYHQAKAQLLLLRDKKISWVTTNAPEVANKSNAFVSMPNDEPVFDSPRQARLGKLRKIF